MFIQDGPKPWATKKAGDLADDKGSFIENRFLRDWGVDLKKLAVSIFRASETGYPGEKPVRKVLLARFSDLGVGSFIWLKYRRGFLFALCFCVSSRFLFCIPTHDWGYFRAAKDIYAFSYLPAKNKSGVQNGKVNGAHFSNPPLFVRTYMHMNHRGRSAFDGGCRWKYHLVTHFLIFAVLWPFPGTYFHSDFSSHS